MPIQNGSNFLRSRAVLRFAALPTMGQLLFVDSVTGVSGGGNTPDAPATTLIGAQTLANANADDVVYVAHTHVETISGAAGMTFSKAGVTYQGLGKGRLRPTITWNTAITAQALITGANIKFSNFVFDFTGFDAITAAILISSADVAFEDCEFIVNSATIGVVLGILTAATAHRLRVERCRFLGPAINAGTTVTACIKHEVGEDYVIKGNYFTGKMTQAILNATACLRGLIDDNRFVIATGVSAVVMNAASTPFITNNNINVPSGTAPIVAAAGFVAGNKYSAAAGVTAGTALTI